MRNLNGFVEFVESIEFVGFIGVWSAKTIQTAEPPDARSHPATAARPAVSLSE
jgi:hypothetical protein